MVTLVKEEDLAQQSTEASSAPAATPLEETPIVKNMKEGGSHLIEVIDLPSKFKLYPKGTRIYYRGYTFNEIEQLSSTSVSHVNKARLGLKGIETEGIKREDVDLFDFFYIMILRKLNTFNTTKIQLDFTCPFCETSQRSVEPLSSVVFPDTDLDYDIPISITLGGVDYEFNSLTVGNFIDEYATNNRDITGLGNIEKLTYMVKNLDKEITKFNLDKIIDPEQINLLYALIDVFNFNNVCMNTKCSDSSCIGHTEDVKVYLFDLLRIATPFRDTKDSIINKFISSKK